jgi:hypothetical protein
MRCLFRLALPAAAAAAVVAACAPARTAVRSPSAAAVAGLDLVPVDLAALAGGGALRTVNRAGAAVLEEPGIRGVRVDERAGFGAVWLEGVDFADGTLEVDVRGRDVDQRSFVGLAFHGAGDSTYDAVYLRPFNFRAADSTRRAHAVQYVALPGYEWRRLREERPGTFEHAVDPAPDPNGWTHLRVVVRGPQVRVYVGEGAEPDLVVEKLTPRTRGRVGLWVGDNSPGDFANLRLTPAR